MARLLDTRLADALRGMVGCALHTILRQKVAASRGEGLEFACARHRASLPTVGECPATGTRSKVGGACRLSGDRGGRQLWTGVCSLNWDGVWKRRGGAAVRGGRDESLLRSVRQCNACVNRRSEKRVCDSRAMCVNVRTAAMGTATRNTRLWKVGGAKDSTQS